jgi:two-component system KDP operon response regulator KdpE
MINLNKTMEQEKTNQPFIGLDYDQVHELRDQELVLIVDDELDTVEMLKIIFRKAGFNVVSAVSGKEAVKKFADTSPNVVLLDLHMPEMDGWEVLHELQRLSDTPVMIISANVLGESVARALDIGAYDYIRKPFHANELISRVRSVLRRSMSTQQLNLMAFPDKGLTINTDTRQVSLQGESIKLSPTEFAVLEVLASHVPNPVSYATITTDVWGDDTPKIRKRLKWAIHLLRRKLEQNPSKPDMIINHFDFGYELLT